jgi:hypothetical protein
MLSTDGPWVQEMKFALTKASIETLLYAKATAPYSIMAPIAGYHHRDPKYHGQLGRLMDEDHEAGFPFRSALVINKDKDRPGGQFYEKARQLGHTIGPTEADEIAFHQDQLKKLGVL